MRILFALIALFTAGAAAAEDGYDLWLRYRPLEAAWQQRYAPAATALIGGNDGATL